MINTEVWIAIFGIIIALIGFLWKTASIYGDLKYQVKRNYNDINRMGEVLREEIKRENWLLRASLNHMQEHLNTKDGYHAPSWRIDDDL